MGQPDLTVADLVLARRDDERIGLRFEDQSWSYAGYVAECLRRAAYLSKLDPAREPHFGVLLDNVPDYCFWLGGAALADATVVGVNPTRRGSDLARDIAHTECQFVVTDASYADLLDGIDVPLVRVEEELPDVRVELTPTDPSRQLLLLFTSGTTAAPKAVICSQGRLARIAAFMTERFALTEDDVCYCAMPMFHGNAIMTSWAPALASGATLALRRKFSASGFLPDIRKYGATYFNYVGRPLAYILATPERADDADNPLLRVFGNEASEPDMREFERRFGCVIQEGYGSSEGGASVNRTADTPPAALGPAPDGVVILDRTGTECPRAQFDEAGRLVNADEAIGEIVNRGGAAGFEGYWRNDEATASRVHGTEYWTGDLGYRDEAGYVYFAGRGDDWLRVDGENVAVVPIEQILMRHPDIAAAVVYGVPDQQVGDLVMAAVELRPGVTFDASEFRAFLDRQPDLGTKMAPRFIRLVSAVPVTSTMKPVRRDLRREAWLCSDPVWWRPTARDPDYLLLTDDDIESLRTEFAQHGRESFWPAEASLSAAHTHRFWRRRRVLAALAVLAVALLAAGVLLVGGRHHAKPAQWDPRILDIVHFVEQTRGLTFKRPVRMEFLTDAAFNKKVNEPSPTSAAAKAELQRSVEELRALGLIQHSVDLVASGNTLAEADVIGLYDPHAKTLYVRGTTLSVDARVMIAHELTHALQDQYFDLARLEKRTPESEQDPLRGLVEGDAVRVQDAYLRTLSASDQRAYLAVVAKAQSGATASTSDVPQVLADELEFPYAFGPAFIDTLVLGGGTAGIDNAFRHPPAAEAQIADPATYPLLSKPVTLPTPSIPTGAHSVEKVQPFGMVSLFEVLSSRLGYDAAWAAVQGWRADSSVPYRSRNRTCIAIDVQMTRPDETARLLRATRSWATHLGRTTVTQVGQEVRIRSCDPGASAPALPHINPPAFDVLAARAELIDAFMTQGSLSFSKGSCIADQTIAGLGPGRYSELAAATLSSAQQEGLRTLVLRAAMACQNSG